MQKLPFTQAPPSIPLGLRSWLTARSSTGSRLLSLDAILFGMHKPILGGSLDELPSVRAPTCNCYSDAYEGAKVRLRFIEKHRTSTDREVLLEYTVLDDPNQPPVRVRACAFPSLLSTFGFSKRPTTSGLNSSLEVIVTFPSLEKVSRVSGVGSQLMPSFADRK